MQNDEIRVATEYFRQREKELGDRWSVNHFENVTVGGRLAWGLRAIFQLETDLGTQYYQSVYVFEEYRSKGLMSEYVTRTKLPFVTMPVCGIEQWFKDRKIPILVVG